MSGITYPDAVHDKQMEGTVMTKNLSAKGKNKYMTERNKKNQNETKRNKLKRKEKGDKTCYWILTLKVEKHDHMYFTK